MSTDASTTAFPAPNSLRAKQNIAEALRSSTGPEAAPRSNGELVFDAPWQSRAFGMALGMCEAGLFDWENFRTELIAAIASKGQNGTDEYYLRWLDALEAVASQSHLINDQELRDRENEYRHHIRDEVF
ncbi:nitrile hydratase accessory protein [Rhodococcus koreensis]